MIKKAIKIDESKHKKVQIYVDSGNAQDILQYVFQDGVDRQFKEIRGLLKENLRNREKYCKVNVNQKAKNIYGMKFTRQRNDRIYFRSSQKRALVMIDLFKGKKSQNIPKKNKNRIDSIGNYEYQL